MGGAVSVECETETECEDNLVCPDREEAKYGQRWLCTYICAACRGLAPGI